MDSSNRATDSDAGIQPAATLQAACKDPSIEGMQDETLRPSVGRTSSAGVASSNLVRLVRREQGERRTWREELQHDQLVRGQRILRGV